MSVYTPSTTPNYQDSTWKLLFSTKGTSWHRRTTDHMLQYTSTVFLFSFFVFDYKWFKFWRDLIELEETSPGQINGNCVSERFKVL